ncbi:hypothetical protein [Nocardioides bizhenqiangii]|uniref:Bacteriocin biosynthesis cyclodehydratase domain-containing protein n=1 Tax=Nocardioides bizhenqiangii TaxID=3095076 RepID=A0ABZ0ZN85_9ACTN|nr:MULTISPECIES: hypothetical protein [unclassified Nocardioides]MDZ5621156.1 hypothetical protein [Nocardioides sp. HM23]WQQ25416.1 hypothetical protein SHK19_15785 [Nocardioides sp. HM61]
MAPVPTSATTVELRLRPGAPVVRRDEDTLQVGLHPPHAVRVPDQPEVRALLDALRAGADPGELAPVAVRALDSLLTAGLAFRTAAGVTPDLDVAQAQHGADGQRRLAERARHRVGVRAGEASRAILDDLMALAGLGVDDASPSVWLVVTSGPITRGTIDPLVRAGAPHLLVCGDGIGRRIGPFVEPGRTACLRCIDAHEAEADPRRPFLVEQAALASTGDEPVDPVLDRLALAWAVRDLCRYFEGDEPSTWSATVDLGPTEAPRVVRWLRHPHCGCAWDLLFDLP